MSISVHHIGLRVASREAAHWLAHVGERSGDWVRTPNVWLKLDVGAGASNAPRPVNMPGIAHICLQSQNIDEGLSKAVQAGVVPTSGPVDLGTPFRYVYAHTDDGILLELEGAPFVRDLGHRFWVGHVAFVARDLEPLVAFYANLALKAPSALSRLGSNPLFDQVTGLADVDLSAMWVGGLNLGLEFWHYHNPSDWPETSQSAAEFSYVCFECANFDADCARARASGAADCEAIEHGLARCKSASFTDPEGNRFCLVAFDDADDEMSVARLPNREILATITDQLQAHHARN